jgi:hypothetical protein
MSTENTSREQILESLKSQVTQKLLEQQANPGSVEITEVDEIPVGYVQGSCRYHVKGVGNLGKWSEYMPEDDQGEESREVTTIANTATTGTAQSIPQTVEIKAILPEAKAPFIDPETKEWILSEQDVEFISIGAGILGTGGGGTAYYAKVIVFQV